MKKVKGVTPVVAVSLLLLIGIGLSGAVYLSFESFSEEDDFDTSESIRFY